MSMNPSIFKAYDIRGIVETALTPTAVRLIGQALGSEAAEQGIAALCIGRDGRLSGPLLRDALEDGIASTGTAVIDVGMVPTPVLYFSTVHLGTGSGVEITGSHNPPEYNGLKLMMGGATLHGDGIQALRARIEEGRLVQGAARGEVRMADVLPAYLEAIVSDVKLARPMKIAID
ncbi:MAG: phosphomannomutase/phosphoglucomutase, partial [Burkholderiaceae bacterium]